MTPTPPPINLGKYGKAIIALATGAIGWGTAVAASASGPITSSEWVGLATVIATALGVYSIQNAQ